MRDFYALKVKVLWRYFLKEHFSFWMICGYLFVEYVRPQSIIPALDILPWAQFFILLSFVGCIMDKTVKWVPDSTNKWMIFFLALICLSILNATYPEISRTHFIDFFGWFVAYFLIINIVNTEKRFFIFLLIFLLATFKISLFQARVWAGRGFSFTSWGLMGPPGYFQNSGELAIQMLMFSPVAYQLAIGIKPHLTRFKYWVMLAMPITGAMTVMGASSRGGQIGMAFQAYYIFLKGKLSLRNLIIALSLVGLGYWAIPDEQKQRFASTGQDKTSQQRVLYWTHGIDMIKEHPFSGIGYFNFPRYYEDYYPHDMLYAHAELPHNIFIQIGTDMGIPGLFVYGFLIFSGFKKTREIRALAKDLPPDSIAVGLTKGLDASLFGFLVAGQFVTVGYYPFMWIHLALVVSLKSVTSKQVRASISG